MVAEIKRELSDTNVTVDECFNESLHLLLWAIREKRKNRVIVSLSPAEGFYYQLTLGILDKINPHTTVDEKGETHSVN